MFSVYILIFIIKNKNNFIILPQRLSHTCFLITPFPFGLKKQFGLKTFFSQFIKFFSSENCSSASQSWAVAGETKNTEIAS